MVPSPSDDAGADADRLPDGVVKVHEVDRRHFRVGIGRSFEAAGPGGSGLAVGILLGGAMI